MAYTPNIDPSSLDVLKLMKSGNAFDTSLIGDISSQVSSMGNVQSLLDPFSVTYPEVDELSTAIAALNLNTTNLQSHVQTQFNNLPQNMNVYTNATNVNSSLSDNLANLCQGINDFFGSILGAGAAIVGKIQQILGKIISAITQGLNFLLKIISDVMAIIQGIIGEIVGLIASELSALGDAIADLFDWGGASSLNALFNHPCAKTIIGTVGTGALIGVLSGAIKL